MGDNSLGLDISSDLTFNILLFSGILVCFADYIISSSCSCVFVFCFSERFDPSDVTWIATFISTLVLVIFLQFFCELSAFCD